MQKMFIAMALCLGFCGVFVQSAHADEAVFYEISPDGETWYGTHVIVPDAGYVSVVLNGVTLYLWGPNFDPAGLPAQTGVMCKCSLNSRSQCQCGNWCAYNGNRNGTCR